MRGRGSGKLRFVVQVAWVFALVFLADNSAAQTNVLIEVSLNAEIYSTDQTFEASVTNVSDDPIENYMWLRIESLRNGVWTEVRGDAECPCKALCKKGKWKIGSAETINISWNFKSDDCNLVPAGTYRAVFIGQGEIELRAYAYSNEFVVH
jgi:hypothetical protein